jgi:hypothetical protein
MMIGASFVMIGVIGFSVQPPESARKGEIQGVGTVRHMSFEDGFWGIVSDDGLHYDVGNLPQEFQVDGLRVRFSVNVVHDVLSFHMWGQIAHLVSIERL